MIDRRFLARFHHAHALGIMVAISFLCYTLLGLVKFYSFRSGIYDLVIFDQGVRGYAGFGQPFSHVKGNWEETGATFSLLGDHFSPILALLAPLYWVHDGPETLIVAQAALLSIAVIPFWIYVRRAIGARSAYLLSTSYLLAWPVAETAKFHFHEYAFVPLITAIMFERLQAGRRWQVLAAAAALLLVKEDLALFVAGFGAALLFMREWRGIGSMLILAGLTFLWLASQVIIPAFGGDPGRYWYYSKWGETPQDALMGMISRPYEILSVLATPETKLWTVALLLAPLLFLPVLSPFFLAPAALLAERMLATDPGAAGWWGTSYHYNSAVVMALFCAAVDGVVRLRRAMPRHPISRFIPSWSALTLTAAVITVPFFALGHLFRSTEFRTVLWWSRQARWDRTYQRVRVSWPGRQRRLPVLNAPRGFWLTWSISNPTLIRSKIKRLT
jgi:uncharacterized membrane protein